MSKPNHYKREQLNKLWKELEESPDYEKCGYYTNSIGSILNAFREADLGFEEARQIIVDLIKTGSCAEIQSDQLVLQMKGKLDTPKSSLNCDSASTEEVGKGMNSTTPAERLLDRLKYIVPPDVAQRILDNFNVKQKGVDRLSTPEKRIVDSRCGCCGGEMVALEQLWCSKCQSHVRGEGIELWERTYFARYGKDCPFDIININDEISDGTKYVG